MYDIAIVGLGPAGAILAQLLSPAMKVVAIDKKRDAPASFTKPCGGLLAPDAQKSLSRLGLNLPKSVLVDPQIFSVRTIDLDSGLQRHYQRFYLNLDRHAFDMWLRSLIPADVNVLDGHSVAEISPLEGGYSLLTHGGTTIRARMIAGCDGANSTVRRHFYPRHKMRSYVAVQQWFENSSPSAFYSCVFDSARTDCYSWGISKDSYFIFGGAYPAQDCRGRFEEQKLALERHGFPLGTPVRTEGCMVLRPSSPTDFATGRDNVFLAGEAAGFISPSSLEGISYAIDSACLLAQALKSGRNPNAAYHKSTAKLRAKLMLKHFKSPFMYNPTLRRLVMKSGVTSISMNKLIQGSAEL